MPARVDCRIWWESAYSTPQSRSLGSVRSDLRRSDQHSLPPNHSVRVPLTVAMTRPLASLASSCSRRASSAALQQWRLWQLRGPVRNSSGTTLVSTPKQPSQYRPTLGSASKHLTAGPCMTVRRAFATATHIPHSRQYSSLSISSDSLEELQFATNPVLTWREFPDFASIGPHNVVPAMEALVRRIGRTFEERLRNFTPTWEGTMGMSTC